jgi:hypothetical protein
MYESFEREYFDMLKTACLKYCLQARIGNMDGIFVAYHNTAEMFGFEYVPLEQMEEDVFGNRVMAPQQFEISLTLVEKVLERVKYYFEKQNVQLLITAPSKNKLFIYAVSLDKPDSNPRSFMLSVVSVTNGLYTTNPYEQTADDEWRLYYDLKEIPFVKAEFERKKSSLIRKYNRMPSSVFSTRLREALRPDEEQIKH